MEIQRVVIKLYVMKLDADKTFRTTIRATIFQFERRADMLVILTPMEYDNVNIADCSVFLRYVLPDGSGKSEQLAMDLEPYNERYYRYRLPIDSTLTEIVGDIECWLDIIDADENILLKSDSATVKVSPRKEIADYLDSESMNQLDRINAEIAQLKRERVNGLRYDDTTRKLVLASDGVPTGNEVTVPGDKYADSIIGDGNNDSEDVWVDMEDAPVSESDDSWVSM